MVTQVPFVEVRNQICALELKKKDILHKMEMTWHLKSRAIWIREGDKNNIFFHHYANHKRKVNSI